MAQLSGLVGSWATVPDSTLVADQRGIVHMIQWCNDCENYIPAGQITPPQPAKLCSDCYEIKLRLLKEIVDQELLRRQHYAAGSDSSGIKRQLLISVEK